MSDNQKGIFNQIKNKTNLKPDDIFKVANSVQNADFTNEKTVRDLVKQLSHMANKPISKEKEDKLVQAIVNNKIPADSQSLNRLFKN